MTANIEPANVNSNSNERQTINTNSCCSRRFGKSVYLFIYHLIEFVLSISHHLASLSLILFLRPHDANSCRSSAVTRMQMSSLNSFYATRSRTCLKIKFMSYLDWEWFLMCSTFHFSNCCFHSSFFLSATHVVLFMDIFSLNLFIYKLVVSIKVCYLFSALSQRG